MTFGQNVQPGDVSFQMEKTSETMSMTCNVTEVSIMDTEARKWRVFNTSENGDGISGMFHPRLPEHRSSISLGFTSIHPSDPRYELKKHQESRSDWLVSRHDEQDSALIAFSTDEESSFLYLVLSKYESSTSGFTYFHPYSDEIEGLFWHEWESAGVTVIRMRLEHREYLGYWRECCEYWGYEKEKNKLEVPHLVMDQVASALHNRRLHRKITSHGSDEPTRSATINRLLLVRSFLACGDEFKGGNGHTLHSHLKESQGCNMSCTCGSTVSDSKEFFQSHLDIGHQLQCRCCDFRGDWVSLHVHLSISDRCVSGLRQRKQNASKDPKTGVHHMTNVDGNADQAKEQEAQLKRSYAAIDDELPQQSKRPRLDMSPGDNGLPKRGEFMDDDASQAHLECQSKERQRSYPAIDDERPQQPKGPRFNDMPPSDNGLRARDDPPPQADTRSIRGGGVVKDEEDTAVSATVFGAPVYLYYGERNPKHKSPVGPAGSTLPAENARATAIRPPRKLKGSFFRRIDRDMRRRQAEGEP
ncbi:hypothetical protein BZA05DRAFT_442872 [Tricharina praecox]|uniref:uncharacterized protein n=1 Tax=Tricharina praecox TaxID=43433 RepID=UPI00221EA257|nr:uncharacterized protein BZA05DRAFT_442872 [Tricharina praecox]KAI5855206.1 hypothetical protein BZA05DRAFT_442872 [Tricharina praecox]